MSNTINLINVDAKKIQRTNTIQQVSKLATQDEIKTGEKGNSHNATNAIFWLRRIVIQWTDYHIVKGLQQELVNDPSNKDQIIKKLQASDRFKSYFSYEIYGENMKKMINRTEKENLTLLGWCEKMGFSITSRNDVFDGLVYTVTPNWNTQSKLKFTSIIRLMKYSTKNQEINQEYLENKYFVNRDVIHRMPSLMALDIISGTTTVNHENIVLTSAIKLSVGDTIPTIVIGSKEHQLKLGYELPSTTKEVLNTSITVRSIGIQKHVERKGKGTKSYRQRDTWQLLSQQKKEQTEIIAMNTPNYRDCVLVYRNFSMSDSDIALVEPTIKHHKLSRGNNNYDRIRGLIAIQHLVTGKVEILGMVVVKKNKDLKKNQLWYFHIIKYEREEIFDKRDPITGKNEYRVKEKIKVVDTEIRKFMSLYGIRHHGVITPGRLSNIGGEQKNLNIDWGKLVGLTVLPMLKNGSICHHPKYLAAYTVIRDDV